MDALWEALRHALGTGLEPKDYTVGQVCLRAFIVYLAGLVILRLGDNRFLGRNTVFDIVLGFILGSVLSRGINGSSGLLTALGATALLVALHYLLAWGAFHSHRFGRLVKGEPETLVRDGQVIWKGLQRKAISRHDLEEALRLQARTDKIDDVREARCERNGDISIVKQPRIVEVRVEAGVQTVRLEIS